MFVVDRVRIFLRVCWFTCVTIDPRASFLVLCLLLAVDVRAGFIAAIITLAVDARADFVNLLASLLLAATDVRGGSCAHFSVCVLIYLCYHWYSCEFSRVVALAVDVRADFIAVIIALAVDARADFAVL